MNPTRWWWIRHAPVVGHSGRIYGQDDVDCDCGNAALFAQLAGRLPTDALWITTPLRRTKLTAAALQQAGAPKPAGEREEVAFLEQHFGEWQGLSYDEFAILRDGVAHRFWHAPASERPPQGESFAEVVERVARAVEAISAAETGQDIVVVAHGGSIRAALAHALAIDPERALGFAIDNCSLTRLDHFTGEGAWRVGSVNFLPQAQIR
ncbi:MAG TPA: histidine phosphatase family protein [Dongiaceae bacterium]|jgi:alpha-ribazole phosphatase|nr:histidine phosphatase family protein [Dongiaceae bacterium]